MKKLYFVLFSLLTQFAFGKIAWEKKEMDLVIASGQSSIFLSVLNPSRSDRRQNPVSYQSIPPFKMNNTDFSAQTLPLIAFARRFQVCAWSQLFRSLSNFQLTGFLTKIFAVKIFTVLFFTGALSAATPVTTDDYEWNQIGFGGGGYVVGIVRNPKIDNQIYCRIDVAGVFKWNFSRNQWDRLTGIQPRAFSQGCDGLALDPNNADVVFAVLGSGFGRVTDGVFKSTNQGKNWTLVLPDTSAWTDPGIEKTYGECIIIDPNDSNIVYHGTRSAKIFRSTSAGDAGTWSEIFSATDQGAGFRALTIGNTPAEQFNPVVGTNYSGTSAVFHGALESVRPGNTTNTANSISSSIVENVDGDRISLTYSNTHPDGNTLPWQNTRMLLWREFVDAGPYTYSDLGEIVLSLSSAQGTGAGTRLLVQTPAGYFLSNTAILGAGSNVTVTLNAASIAALRFTAYDPTTQLYRDTFGDSVDLSAQTILGVGVWNTVSGTANNNYILTNFAVRSSTATLVNWGGTGYVTATQNMQGTTTTNAAKVIAGLGGDNASHFRERRRFTAATAIYAANTGQGIYRSTDGGNTFSLLPANAAHPTTVERMVTDRQGLLFAVGNGKVGRYDPSSNSWTNITPTNLLADSPPSAIAIHPTDDNKVVVVATRSIFRSDDGGATYTRFVAQNGTLDADEYIYTSRNDWFPRVPMASGPSAILFNPTATNPDELWMVDVYSAYSIPDVYATNPNWISRHQALNITVNLAMASLPASTTAVPNKALFGGFADIVGGAWDSTSLYTDPNYALLGNTGPDITSFDFSESNPEIIWIAKAKNNTGTMDGTVYRSTTGARTAGSFTFIGRPVGAANNNNGGPKIAVSSSDPNRVVYFPGAGQRPRYTADGGTTWLRCKIKGTNTDLPVFGNAANEYEHRTMVCSDRFNGNRFYAFRVDASNVTPRRTTFWRSDDFGATWEENTTVFNGGKLPFTSGQNMTVASSYPVGAGTNTNAIFLALATGGLYKSTDLGATFTKLPGIKVAQGGVSLGKPRAGMNDPAVYVYGTDAFDKWGVFRSEDLGTTWVRITTGINEIPEGRRVQACRQVFGRVSVADGGAAIVVGEIAQQTVTSSQQSAEDAHVRRDTLANTNYGSLTVLETRANGANSLSTREAFLKFDVPDDVATIVSARLTVVPTSVEASALHNLHTVSAGWSESTITHNTAPPLGATITPSFTISTQSVGTTISLDVTSAVQAALANGQPQVAFALISSTSRTVAFGSKEGSESTRPRLVVEYVPIPEPPTGYETWADGFELTGADAEFMADPDGDGKTNFLEYATGTSPTAIDSTNSAEQAELVGGKLRITGIVRSDDPDLIVEVQTTTDLADAQSWTSLGLTQITPVDQTGVLAGYERVTFEREDNPISAFFRFQFSIVP